MVLVALGLALASVLYLAFRRQQVPPDNKPAAHTLMWQRRLDG
jgi:hypothetical protein